MVVMVMDNGDIDEDWENDISAVGVVAWACNAYAHGPGPKHESPV